MQLLSQLQEDKLRYLSIPVLDTFLEAAAKGLGKRVEALEQPNDLCRPFRQLGKQQVSKNNLQYLKKNYYYTKRLLLVIKLLLKLV